jgi:hypothetical protein
MLLEVCRKNLQKSFFLCYQKYAFFLQKSPYQNDKHKEIRKNKYKKEV